MKTKSHLKVAKWCTTVFMGIILFTVKSVKSGNLKNVIIMNMLTSALFSFLLLIISPFLLVKSADLIIKSSSRLAMHYKISTYTISFLVIGFATSIPEFIVGVVSATKGNPLLSFGNVVGSNIADLTIVLAIPIILGGALSTKKIINNKDLLVTVVCGTLPLFLMLDGTLSRSDGFMLIATYLVYVFLVLKRSQGLERILDIIEKVNVAHEWFIFWISIFILIISSDALVSGAVTVSNLLNIPVVFIGLTVTAFGTSLPELIFGLRAIKLHNKDEVIGNLAGSVIANSTLILGVTSLISPIHPSAKMEGSSIIFLLITLLIFYFLAKLNRHLDRDEAVLLMVIYIIFIVVEKSLTGF